MSAERIAPLELERFLPHRVNVIAELMSRTLGAIYRHHFGISVPEWRVLAALAYGAPLSASEVGLRTHMEKARVSRTLSRLQDAGLIRREVDPRDNRVAVLDLSRDGRELFSQLSAMATDWEADLLAGMGDDDREHLTKLLGRLHARIDELRASSSKLC